MKQLLEKILEQEDFEELFQPISDEEKEERIAELMKEYEEGAVTAISEEELESFQQGLKNLGYRSNLREVWLAEPARALHNLDVDVEPLYNKVRMSVSVTADVSSDIYKNLNVQSLRSFFAKHGCTIQRVFYDVYTRDKDKPNIKYKKIVIDIKKRFSQQFYF